MIDFVKHGMTGRNLEKLYRFKKYFNSNILRILYYSIHKIPFIREKNMKVSHNIQFLFRKYPLDPLVIYTLIHIHTKKSSGKRSSLVNQ